MNTVLWIAAGVALFDVLYVTWCVWLSRGSSNPDDYGPLVMLVIIGAPLALVAVVLAIVGLLLKLF